MFNRNKVLMSFSHDRQSAHSLAHARINYNKELYTYDYHNITSSPFFKGSVYQAFSQLLSIFVTQAHAGPQAAPQGGPESRCLAESCQATPQVLVMVGRLVLVGCRAGFFDRPLHPVSAVGMTAAALHVLAKPSVRSMILHPELEPSVPFSKAAGQLHHDVCRMPLCPCVLQCHLSLSLLHSMEA